MNKTGRINISKIVYIIFLLAYTGVLVYLFYNQLLYPETGLFESDTSAHVSFAVDDGYYHSLASFIYVFFNKIGLLNVLTAITLSVMCSGAVVLTGHLIKNVFSLYGESINEPLLYVISFLSNFVMGFYVGSINKRHYIGYENANMWHNSTYIFMRFFALLSLIFFIKLYNGYKEKISVKNLIVYTVLLTVTTGFKASFLTVFAPLLFLMLLYDLIKGTKFIKVFVMALSVVPSLFVMLLQSIVMGGGGENGYIISPFTALSMRGEHPKVTLVLSVLFPICVLFTHLKDAHKDKAYFWSLIMWAIGFLEVFLFAESGERELDGNFFWGYSISLFFVFMMSMVRLYRDFKANIQLKKKLCIVYNCFAAVILMWHAVSGVWYLGLLLTGVTYFV